MRHVYARQISRQFALAKLQKPRPKNRGFCMPSFEGSFFICPEKGGDVVGCGHDKKRFVAVISNSKSLTVSLYKCVDCGADFQVTENAKRTNPVSKHQDPVYQKKSQVSPVYVQPRKEVVRDYSNSACVKCRHRLASSFRVNDSGIVRLCLICVIQYDKENV